MKQQQGKNKPGSGGDKPSSTPQTDAAASAQQMKARAEEMLKNLDQAVDVTDKLIQKKKQPRTARVCYCREPGCRIGPMITIKIED